MKVDWLDLQMEDSSLSHTYTHSYIRYVGYTLLSINMICLLFLSRPSSLGFCQLWPLMCSVYCVCEKQLPRDPSPCFTALLLFFLLFSLTTSFMLLCVNPAIFQTMQMFYSPMTFLWHFSRLCGTGKKKNWVISCQETRCSY